MSSSQSSMELSLSRWDKARLCVGRMPACFGSPSGVPSIEEPEVAELALDLAREEAGRTLDATDNLDTKAGVLLAAVGVLGPLATTVDPSWLGIIGLGAGLLAGGPAFAALWPRTVYRVSASDLPSALAEHPRAEVREVVLAHQLVASFRNRVIQEQKSLWVRCSAGLLYLGSVLVVLDRLVLR